MTAFARGALLALCCMSWHILSASLSLPSPSSSTSSVSRSSPPPPSLSPSSSPSHLLSLPPPSLSPSSPSPLSPSPPPPSPSFRGIPHAAYVHRISFRVEHGSVENYVDICYRFSLTAPAVNFADVASIFTSGEAVPVMELSRDMRADASLFGVMIPYRVQGHMIWASLASEVQPFSLSQISFLNSAVRATAGVAKPLQLVSYAHERRTNKHPRSQWVKACESIAFGKAYSQDYVVNLFRGPGPIGFLRGRAQFGFTVHGPPSLIVAPPSRWLKQSNYVVPIFGFESLREGDVQMLRLSHFVNSTKVLEANVDDNHLSRYLQIHASLIDDFKPYYTITLPLPVDNEHLGRFTDDANAKARVYP